MPGSTTMSPSPCWTSVGAATAPSRSCRRTPPRRPPAPPSRPDPCAVASAVHEDPVDELEPRGRGASAFSTNSRRRVGRSVGASRSTRPFSGASGTRRAPRRGAGEHEPVDPLRMAERELLRDHPAKAGADHVRALDSRLVEHLRRRRRPSRRPCTGRGARRSRRRRGCRTGAREACGERLDARAPSPSAHSRGRGSAAAGGPAPGAPRRSLTRALLRPASRLSRSPVQPRQPTRHEEDQQDEERAENEKRLGERGREHGR